VILTYLRFMPGAVATSEFVALMPYGLGFQPSQVRSDMLGSRRSVPYSTRVMNQLAMNHRPSATVVEGSGGERFQLTGIAGWPAQVIILETADPPPESLIRAAGALSGFTPAMVGDADDVFWESEKAGRDI